MVALATALCAALGVAIPTIHRTLTVWFKWELGNFGAAVAALPVTLDHLTSESTLPTAIVVEGHVISYYLLTDYCLFGVTVCLGKLLVDGHSSVFDNFCQDLGTPTKEPRATSRTGLRGSWLVYLSKLFLKIPDGRCATRADGFARLVHIDRTELITSRTMPTRGLIRTLSTARTEGFTQGGALDDRTDPTAAAALLPLAFPVILFVARYTTAWIFDLQSPTLVTTRAAHSGRFVLLVVARFTKRSICGALSNWPDSAACMARSLGPGVLQPVAGSTNPVTEVFVWETFGEVTVRTLTNGMLVIGAFHGRTSLIAFTTLKSSLWAVFSNPLLRPQAAVSRALLTKSGWSASLL